MLPCIRNDEDEDPSEDTVLLCGTVEIIFDDRTFDDVKGVEQMHANVISWLSYLCVVELLLIPIYIFGSNFISCGKSLGKTTAAYLADADVAEGFVAVLVSAHLVICACRIVYLYSDRVQKQLSAAAVDEITEPTGPQPSLPWKEQVLAVIGFVLCIVLSGIPSFLYAVATTSPVSLERSEREPTLIAITLGTYRSIVRTRPSLRSSPRALDSPEPASSILASW